MLSDGLVYRCKHSRCWGAVCTGNACKSILVCVALFLANMACLPNAHATPTAEEVKEQIGYYQLQGALGIQFPLGSGVPIVHVEASSAGMEPPVYFPNTAYSEFLPDDDPFSESVTFIDMSGGAGNGSSGHATSTVGQFFYGNNFSVAPGANTVNVYEANHWLSNVLNVDSTNPTPQDYRVANFSWVGSFGSSSTDAQVLGRFDYLIDNNNITAVVGSNSGGTPTALLTHSLNAIAVGVTPGTNPTNPTSSFYFPGRIKPDIVSVGNAASQTTASVSSAATMLHESAIGSNASQSEVMKAILMAGATKDEFPSWSQTATEPLDSTYGAGELNVYNSYVIQHGGNFSGSLTEPTSPVGIDGWDYSVATQGSPLYYNFEIPAGSTAQELSVILTWNAQVTDSQPGALFVPDVSFDNLDLKLFDSSASFLGTEIAASTSSNNNVEHLYLSDLAPGTYTLELANVTLGGSRDFGLAWRLETLFDIPSADFDEDGNVDAGELLTWQRNFGTLTGATHATGDADGDGDVDEDDLAIANGSFGTSPVFLPSVVVPEPSSLALFTAATFLVFFQRSLNRS